MLVDEIMFQTSVIQSILPTNVTTCKVQAWEQNQGHFCVIYDLINTFLSENQEGGLEAQKMVEKPL